MKIEHLIILDMLPKNWIVEETTYSSRATHISFNIGMQDEQVYMILYNELYPTARNRQWFPTNALLMFLSGRSTDVLFTDGKWLFDEKDTRLWNEIWPESIHFEIIEYIE